MKNLQRLLCALLYFPTLLIAQVNYDDVAVIVNANSEISIQVAEYFQQERDIPDLNMIYVDAADQEEINDDEFEYIRLQIENYLTNNNLVDSINYIVTTKGVPMKVQRANCFDPMTFGPCASFDNEITLILSADSDAIGESNPAINPYYEADSDFSRDEFGIYLVTRLDGFSYEDIKDLIDRSGPETLVNQESSNFIYDLSYVDSILLTLFSNDIYPAIDTLETNSWNVTFHPDSSYLTNQIEVLGYYSINLKGENIDLNHSWTNGSFAEINHTNSAATFTASNNPTNDLIIPNLIAEGATGVAGYTYLHYVSTTTKPELIFKYYTDKYNDYNLAESYYMSTPRLSYQYLLVGDPKTSIFIDNTIATNNPNLINEVSVFPNPGTGNFFIKSNDLIVNQIDIINQLGQTIFSTNEIDSNSSIPIYLVKQSSGLYFFKITTNEGTVIKQVIKQ